MANKETTIGTTTRERLLARASHITWACSCGATRVWVTESDTICIECDVKTHGTEVIADLLNLHLRRGRGGA